MHLQLFASGSGFILKLIWLLLSAIANSLELCSIFKSIPPFVQLTVIHLKKADIDPDSLFRKRSRSLKVLDSGPSLAVFPLLCHCRGRLMQGGVTVRSSIDFLTQLHEYSLS